MICRPNGKLGTTPSQLAARAASLDPFLQAFARCAAAPAHLAHGLYVGRAEQIARALGAGKTFKSVARQCDIAVSTVANHATRIYRKLGVFRREELVDLMRQSAISPSATGKSA